LNSSKTDRKFSWRSIFDTVPSSNFPVVKNMPKRSQSTSSPPCQKVGNLSTIWYRGLSGDKKPAPATDLFLPEPNKYISGVTSSNSFKLVSDFVSPGSNLEPLKPETVIQSDEPPEMKPNQYFTSFKPHDKKTDSCNLSPEKPVRREIQTLQRSRCNQPINKTSLKTSASFNFYSELEKQQDSVVPPLNPNETKPHPLVESRRQRIETILKHQKEQLVAKQIMMNQTAPKPVVYRSKRDGSPHFFTRENSLDSKSKSKFSQFLRFRRKVHQNQESNKTATNNEKQSHRYVILTWVSNFYLDFVMQPIFRLSAPNLSQDSTTLQNKNLPQIIAELKRKQRELWTQPEKPGLHTINEGLVTTPMLARKSRNVSNKKESKRRLSKSADDIFETSTSPENGLKDNNSPLENNQGFEGFKLENLAKVTEKVNFGAYRLH